MAGYERHEISGFQKGLQIYQIVNCAYVALMFVIMIILMAFGLPFFAPLNYYMITLLYYHLFKLDILHLVLDIAFCIYITIRPPRNFIASLMISAGNIAANTAWVLLGGPLSVQ